MDTQLIHLADIILQLLRQRRLSLLAVFVSMVLYLGRLLLSSGREIFLNRIFASITIDYSHDLHRVVLNWASQRFAHSARLKVAPARPDDQNELEPDAGIPGKLFYARQGKMLARFEPDYGIHAFIYCRRLFFFQRRRRQGTSLVSRGNEEEIILSTLSRNTRPIKEFLDEMTTRRREETPIVIWMARSRDRISGSMGLWKRLQERHPRPLNSIFMDEETKSKVVKDMDGYLKPSTARWYAENGIPWRRGYLFHGTPGTGKTSLTFALAGLFGLDIYIVSLADSGLQDSYLLQLFTSLPRRCLVLLEDVDAAGIGRLGKSLNETAGITLSGLLNAIDGVPSPEGRVLVMSTNFRNQLDDALIRPGRIDYQVKFTLAKKCHVRNMFIQLYSYQEDVEKLADDFTDAIPENTFSAAEIQCFLVGVKGDPCRAIEGVGEWVRARLEEREQKRKSCSTVASGLSSCKDGQKAFSWWKRSWWTWPWKMSLR